MGSDTTLPSKQLDARKKQPVTPVSVGVDKVVLLLVVIYLLVPLAATLVFGLSGSSGLDLSVYGSVFSDGDFSQTLLLSLELAVLAMVLSIALVTPTVYWVQLRMPRARALLDFLSLVPFAVPAILMSLGLLEVYANPNPVMSVLSLGLVPLLSGPPFVFANSPQ